MPKDIQNDDEKSKSFWGTLPGLLTGCAAVITAIGGFITAIYLLWPKDAPVPVEASPTQPAVILQPTSLPEDLFEIVRANSGRTYFKGVLTYGAVVYADRDYIYNDIPPFIDGAEYILTANEDKFGSDEFELSLLATRNVDVYIGHSDRYTNKPDWLMTFQDIGADLTFYAGSDLVTLSLYKRSYPAGPITLYGNIQSNETANHAMYTIVIVEDR
ncbi:MAG TPA: hypothetical protein PLR65_09980, partial [Anaerolineales bacterium]|nr:hypothetical protein [Anaerolineales bacterium]